MTMKANSGPGKARNGDDSVHDIRLLAIDGEIDRLVLQVEQLEARRQRTDQSGERERICRQIRTLQKKIAKLYANMSRARPESLIGAAALLRRVPAMLNERLGNAATLSIAGQMIDSALVVVEKSSE